MQTGDIKTMKTKQTKIFFFAILFLLFSPIASSTNTEILHAPKIESDSIHQLDRTVNNLLDQGYKDNMFPGIAVALYAEDTIKTYNRGYAKLESQIELTNETKFQLGSVGKLLTGISILQLYDQNKIDLNADITIYVNDLGLDLGSTKNRVTLHCLLTHSCGFNDANIGYMVKDKANVMPLKDYLKKTNARLFQPPNTEINYSNFSYAIAGYIVEKISQKSFSNYVNDNIFKPLKMENSTLEFPEEYENNPQYATSYRHKKNEFVATQVYPRHAIPAGSLVSTSQDMSLFIKALYNKDSKLLSQSAWKMFYTEQFSNNTLLNGYGYGLEHQNINGLTSWAKAGMVPGFLSHIYIVPGKFAIFTVTNTDDDQFGELFYKSILDEIYPNKTELKENLANIILNNYTGTYRNKRYNHETEENIVSLFKGQFNVYLDDKGDSLAVYHNGMWHAYIPIDKGVFQNTLLPYEYLVFEENKKGEVISLYRNQNIGGLSVPLSYEKTKWFNSPEFINEYYGLIPIFTFTGFIYLIINLMAWAFKRWKNKNKQSKPLPNGFYSLLIVTLCLHLIHTIKVPWQIMTQSSQFLLGYPLSFKIFSILGYILIPLTFILGFYIWQIYSNKLRNLFTRIYLLLLELSIIIHLVFLFYWGFL